MVVGVSGGVKRDSVVGAGRVGRVDIRAVVADCVGSFPSTCRGGCVGIRRGSRLSWFPACALANRFPPLPVLRERVGVRVFLPADGEDPHPCPLPEYRERGWAEATPDS